MYWYNSAPIQNIVKISFLLKEDRDELQQVVFTHIGFPPYIMVFMCASYV